MPPPKGRNESLQPGSKIMEVVNVEESIWNSCYGFKAKIDCILKVFFPIYKYILQRLILYLL